MSQMSIEVNHQLQNNNYCASGVSGSARKRPISSSDNHQSQVEPPLNKRRLRVVLGDITNFNSTIAASASASAAQSRIKKLPFISKSKSTLVVVKEEAEAVAHSDDPQMCAAYAQDIYHYLHSLEIEIKRRPRADYIEKVQTDVTSQMRGVLVDWLVEVADEYKLLSDTLYLAVDYLDRFLSSNLIIRQRLQLLGVSCMLIASKFEEISPPHVQDFCYITDHTFTEQEVVKMESHVLNALKFEMGNPTAKTFLRRFSRTAQGNSNTPNLKLEFLGCYLAELSLLDYACIRFLPSLIAASGIFLTNLTIQPNLHPWNSTLQQQSGYRPIHLKECVSILHDLQLNRRGSSLLAVRDKYRQHKFKCVATMISPSEIPMEYFEDAKQ